MLHNTRGVDDLTGKLASWQALVQGQIVQWDSGRWIRGPEAPGFDYRQGAAIDAELRLLNRTGITPSRLLALLQAARVKAAGR